MPRSHFARVLLILLVVGAVAAPSAWAAPHRLSTEIAAFDIFARLWDSLTAIWEEAGCTLDPHGGCGTDQPPTTDAGCGLDPHGGCATTQEVAPPPPPTLDEGCNADPHGGCTPGS